MGTPETGERVEAERSFGEVDRMIRREAMRVYAMGVFRAPTGTRRESSGVTTKAPESEKQVYQKRLK